MSKFRFNFADVTPQTSIEVDADPKRARAAKTGSEAEKIYAARLRVIERSKISNAPGAQYGLDCHESYYQDFAGPETSKWEAAVLVCIANILEAPILSRSKFVWQSDHYDPRTGCFNLSDTPAVSIQELKSAIDARIVELDLSKAKIWEWFSDVREPIGSEWWRQDLENRIQKFKATA